MVTNYFELFDLPVDFEMDLKELSRRHRERIRERHPDRFVQASSQERRLAVTASATLNDGLKVLRDPVARARHILELHGVSTDEETDTVMDPGFLGEQMGWREALEEGAGDAGSVEALTLLVEQSQEAKQRHLAQALADGGSEGHQRARRFVRELQFLQRFAQELDEARSEVS